MLRRICWAAMGVYWGICFYLTHAQLPPGGPGISYDKLKHYIGYGGLGGAWYLCAWMSRPRWRWTPLAVLALGMIYGAFDELTQPAFGRSADIFDWLADIAGILTAIVGMRAILSFRSSEVAIEAGPLPDLARV